MNVCPDPRGPMVDRPDFIEGQIDALQELQARFREKLWDVHDDPSNMDIRLLLDEQRENNTPLEQYAAELDLGVVLIDSEISEALQQARWKLARVLKAGAS